MLRRLAFTAIAICFFTGALAANEDREAKVRNDKKALDDDDFWIYNDLDKGIAEAKRTGKPLLIVFR